MHILIAANGIPPTHSAGAERQAERMAHWLVAHGHQVTISLSKNWMKRAFVSRPKSRMVLWCIACITM